MRVCAEVFALLRDSGVMKELRRRGVELSISRELGEGVGIIANEVEYRSLGSCLRGFLDEVEPGEAKLFNWHVRIENRAWS